MRGLVFAVVHDPSVLAFLAIPAAACALLLRLGAKRERRRRIGMAAAVTVSLLGVFFGTVLLYYTIEAPRQFNADLFTGTLVLEALVSPVLCLLLFGLDGVLTKAGRAIGRVLAHGADTSTDTRRH